MHRSSLLRWSLVAGIVAALAIAAWPVGATQGATPTPCPTVVGLEDLPADVGEQLCRALAGELPPPAGDVPAPAECAAAPRPVDAVARLLTPPAGTASPVPAVPQAGAGVPADAATTAGVSAIVRQFFACTNTGDQRRVYALATDAFVRRLFAGASPEQLPGLLASLATPTAVGQQVVVLHAIRDVRVLPDGRATAVAEAYNPYMFRDATFAFVLARGGAGWLIDGLTVDAPAPATPPA